MITVSLNEIRAQSPCESGWKKVLASKGGTSADMDAQFPMTDILESNDLDDALWSLRCRPEHSNLWRKFAVWCARQVEHLMTDERSRNALDVAWKHSEGLATNAELAAAHDAAWVAAWVAQKAKLIEILTAGEWGGMSKIMPASKGDYEERVMFDYDDDERPTPRQRWYQQDLARHPDCRDPEHPGCENCYVSEHEEEGEDDDA